MNVYVDPPAGLSRAMTRVGNALKRYAPKHVRIIPYVKDADLVVVHVTEMSNLRETTHWLRQLGKQYAIIQYCLRTTDQPDTHAWLDIWEDAVVVWSYYDLRQAMREDGGIMTWFPFYHAPLGVDPDTFFVQQRERNVTIMTSGYLSEPESVHEVIQAVRYVKNGRIIHLGPDVSQEQHILCVLGIDDSGLRRLYNRCRFVSGLRKVEGFELPAAEGLLCGARPILYDKPHYRKWYDGLARFIPEGDFNDTVQALIPILEQDDPVKPEEIEDAKHRFDWAFIVDGFWHCVGTREWVVS